MSVSSVEQFFATHYPAIRVIYKEVETSTVDLAALAFGVVPGMIAKTLAFRLKNQSVILVVIRGDYKVENKKFTTQFGKGKMLPLEEVEVLTGHPVGGVCPFGLSQPLPIYADISLTTFPEVIPAAGATNTAVRISPQLLVELTQALWVDVCQAPSA
ncbi:MAG: YbaK/EbsC family protein [Gammaproteobacteria bacterium]|nr:YbaK/EbsC family protein [Gammaproteobacteria bacterium]